MISMDFFFYEMPRVQKLHTVFHKKIQHFFLFFHKAWGYRQQINMFHSILTNFGAESPFSALNLFCLLQ